MKTLYRISFLAAIFISFSFPAYADVLELPSKISAVTVYPGAAHITRTITLDLPAGEHTIIFDKINPPLDENTLSVSGEGTASVKIYGGYIKQEFLKQTPDAKVAELEGKIQDLDDQTLERNGYAEVLDQKKEYLNSIKLFAGGQLPKDLVTTMPSVDTLKGVGNLLAEQLSDIEKQKNEIRIKLRDIAKERNTLTQELNTLHANVQNNIQRRLAVDLECTKPGKFTLNAAYLVNGAFWRPLYDARTEIAKSEVELTSFGVVKQNTGEDWSDVALTLSTAKPNIGGRMPYVAPWILQPYQVMPAARAKGGLGIQDSLKSAVDDIQDQYSIGNTAVMSTGVNKEEVVAEKKADIAFSTIAQNGLSISFKIPRLISLKSDGTENKFPIATQTLKAEFQYSSNPKATPISFLNSDVNNSADLQLLAGEVNLFLEGDFVGKSDIQNVGSGEKFSLYLGVNENVKVKREQLDKRVDDIIIAGIPSPNRTTTYKMKITIENYESRKIKYNLFEAIPTTQNDKQIKIRVFDVNPAPFKKDWDDRKGVWQWMLELNPKEKKEVVYTFSVENPRDMQVSGI